MQHRSTCAQKGPRAEKRLRTRHWILAVSFTAASATGCTNEQPTQTTTEPSAIEESPASETMEDIEESVPEVKASNTINREMEYSSIPLDYLNINTYQNVCHALYIRKVPTNMIANDMAIQAINDGNYHATNTREYEHLISLIDTEWCLVIEGY